MILDIINIILLIVLSFFVYNIYNRKPVQITKPKTSSDLLNELEDIEKIVDFFFIKSYSHIYYTKLNQALIKKTPLYNPVLNKYLGELIQFYKEICPEELLLRCIIFYGDEESFINIIHLKFITKLYSDRLYNAIEDETTYQRDEL